MIQIKRGKTANWKKQRKPLAAGQPGYDKDKHKLKIGDGSSSWDDLPYASGPSSEEILSSEADAKLRRATATQLNPLSALFAAKDSPAIITYGTESPDNNTVGQLYLQCYDAEPEVDYVVKTGVDGIWTYQLFKSGIARCFGSLEITTPLHAGNEKNMLYCDNAAITSISYPSSSHFSFIDLPIETACVHGSGKNVVWLASRGINDLKHTAEYAIVCMDRWNSATYKVNISVEGRWR